MAVVNVLHAAMAVAGIGSAGEEVVSRVGDRAYLRVTYTAEKPSGSAP